MKSERLLILLIGILIGGIFFSIGGAGTNFESPFGSNSERASPSDWIKKDQIKIEDDKLILEINNAMISSYANTNSMDPVLDENSNGIEILAQSPEQISIGDIITYEKGNDLIVHRVYDIGHDSNGWYCITKGDNNFSDDGKIRFKDIKYITIGIIY